MANPVSPLQRRCFGIAFFASSSGLLPTPAASQLPPEACSRAKSSVCATEHPERTFTDASGRSQHRAFRHSARGLEKIKNIAHKGMGCRAYTSLLCARCHHFLYITHAPLGLSVHEKALFHGRNVQNDVTVHENRLFCGWNAGPGEEMAKVKRQRTR